MPLKMHTTVPMNLQKVGGVKVGTMRTASQGAFYILPESDSDDDSGYGGTYDKATIQKLPESLLLSIMRLNKYFFYSTTRYNQVKRFNSAEYIDLNIRTIM